MCLACGQMLAGTEEKCPSCGAPTRRGKAGRRGTLKVTGLLFLVLALYVAALGIGIVMEATAGFPESEAGFSAQRFLVSGRVQDVNGTGMAGVVVEPALNRTQNTTTDANGTFAVSGFSQGFHRVRFVRENFTTVELRVVILSQLDNVTVTMAPGNGTITRDHSSYTTVVRTWNICGSLVAATGLLMLAGGLACYRRRSYRVALWAGIVAVVLAVPLTIFLLAGRILFLPVIIMSIIVLVMVVRNRREFR